uniref:Uncharacterized protein n=1 Tax=Arundo donax TaxID=35708 RepID=A0A0A9DZ19_ARUDO
MSSDGTPTSSTCSFASWTNLSLYKIFTRRESLLLAWVSMSWLYSSLGISESVFPSLHLAIMLSIFFADPTTCRKSSRGISFVAAAIENNRHD